MPFWMGGMDGQLNESGSLDEKSLTFSDCFGSDSGLGVLRNPQYVLEKLLLSPKISNIE